MYVYNCVQMCKTKNLAIYLYNCICHNVMMIKLLYINVIDFVLFLRVV